MGENTPKVQPTQIFFWLRLSSVLYSCTGNRETSIALLSSKASVIEQLLAALLPFFVEG